MNEDIQKYLKNNNATISFTNDCKVEVTYDYGQLGKVEQYDSFNQMFNWIKWDVYNQSIKLELEISGRQTGKTSRLVDAMVKHIKVDGICFLYCISQDMGKIIRSKIQEILPVTELNGIVYINPTGLDFAKMDINDLKHVRYFFDEFDFLKKEHQTYHPTGYYCTTPSKLRDSVTFSKLLAWSKFICNDDNIYSDSDLLERLIMRTNFNFERRMNYDLVKRFGNDYPKEKLRIESGEIFR